MRARFIAALLLTSFSLIHGTWEVQAGLLDHFSWSSVPGEVEQGQAFPVTVSGRDQDGGTISNLTGTVILTELLPAEAPRVLISEVQTGFEPGVEIANLTESQVDVSGWRIVFYDRFSWPAPKTAFVFPDSTFCLPSGVIKVNGGGSFPGSYPVFHTGVSVGWSNSRFNNHVAVLLLNDEDQPVDFFSASEAFAPLISVPSTIGQSSWKGPPVPANTDWSLTYQRVGQVDNDNAADWMAAPNSIGILNPLLRLPFRGTPRGTPTIPGSVNLTNGVWTGLIAAVAPGSNAWLRADDGAGHSGDSDSFKVAELPALGLHVPGSASKANPGQVGQGTVTVPHALSTNLTVALSNSLPGHFIFPSTATILAGMTNAAFAVSNIDNGLLEGPQVATITARATGFDQASQSITNLDREMPVLSFSMGTSIPETYNWVGTAQVFSSLPAAANVVVQLSSDKPDRLQVQDFVTIPAGQTSARFGLAILDNNRIDGDELVTLNATVPGWISAQGQITVRDNEGTNLTLSLPTTAHEGSGVISNVGIVQISAPLPTDLTVNLSSSATDKLQVPASVIISTGQTEALFDVKLPDDDIAATNHVVVVNATAVGFKPAARNVNVRDNDASSFLVGGPGGAAQLVGEPFAMTVQALNASGNVIPGYSGSLNLQAIGLMGSVSVTSSIVGPLTNGQWSGFATVTDVSSSVVLTVNDGLGHTGSSAPFDVITGFVVNLPVSDFVYDPLRQKIQAAENTPPSFRR